MSFSILSKFSPIGFDNSPLVLLSSKGGSSMSGVIYSPINILLENYGYNLTLENYYPLLMEGSGNYTPSQSGQLGFYQYYIYANQNRPYVLNAGGTALGSSSASRQNNRSLTSDFGYINLGAGQIENNSPNINVVPSQTGSNYNTMKRGEYIIMNFSSKIAGKTNNILVSPGQEYQRISQNQNIGYVNTWLKRTTGGWYYQTGQPINAQYSRDYIIRENYQTSRLTYEMGFLPNIVIYQKKTD